MKIYRLITKENIWGTYNSVSALLKEYNRMCRLYPKFVKEQKLMVEIYDLSSTVTIKDIMKGIGY